MNDKNGKSLDELTGVTKCKVKLKGKNHTGEIQALHPLTKEVTVRIGDNQHTVKANTVQLL